MIHYTLLPEKEIRKLKREYRTRLLIVLFFFLSFSVLVGIAALVPAYLFSSLQEKEALQNLQGIKKERQEKGVEDILKNLTETSELVKKVKAHQSKIVSSDTIARIVAHRTAGIQMNSFQFSTVADTGKNATTSTTQVVVQGKASTREGLVNFKNSIEDNVFFSKVEFPISDLTKSRDIPFSFRLTINTTQ